MRKVDAKNQIWYTQDGEVVKLGLTKSFIDSLDQCWHILPANTEQVRKKSPLFVVETNDSMISIMSPLEGYVNMYNMDAQDFPDRLDENTVLMELVSNEPVRQVVPPDGLRFDDFIRAPEPLVWGNAPQVAIMDDVEVPQVNEAEAIRNFVRAQREQMVANARLAAAQAARVPAQPRAPIPRPRVEGF